MKDLGAKLGVEVHVRRPTKAFDTSGFQAKARAWRRDEAEKLLDAVAGRVILQGHHADDQTETVLMKMMRGVTYQTSRACRIERANTVAPCWTFRRRNFVVT